MSVILCPQRLCVGTAWRRYMRVLIVYCWSTHSRGYLTLGLDCGRHTGTLWPTEGILSVVKPSGPSMG